MSLLPHMHQSSLAPISINRMPKVSPNAKNNSQGFAIPLLG